MEEQVYQDAGDPFDGNEEEVEAQTLPHLYLIIREHMTKTALHTPSKRFGHINRFSMVEGTATTTSNSAEHVKLAYFRFATPPRSL